MSKAVWIVPIAVVLASLLVVYAVVLPMFQVSGLIFGLDTKGLNRSDLPNDRIFAQKVTVSSSVTLRTFYFFFEKGDAGSVALKIAIYSESNANDNPIGEGTFINYAEQTIPSVSAAGAWYSFQVPDTSLSAGTYWIAFKTSWVGISLFSYFNTVGSNSFTITPEPYANAWPNPFATWSSNFAQQMSLYGSSVTPSPPPPPPPPPTELVADFTFGPSSPIENDTVTFTASVSGGTSPYISHWVFGDGSTSLTGSTVTHAFSISGTYTVTVEITDSAGATKTVSKPITIYEPGQAPPPSQLVISFSYSASGRNATFTASVTGGTGPYAYSWDFGDGTTGSGNPASHLYGQAATETVSYNVGLAVTDGAGGTASTSTTINVTNTGFTSGQSALSSQTGMVSTITSFVRQNYLLTGLVAGVVIIAVVGFSLKRRK